MAFFDLIGKGMPFHFAKMLDTRVNDCLPQLARRCEQRAPLKENTPDRVYSSGQFAVSDTYRPTAWQPTDGDAQADGDWRKQRTPYGHGIEAKRISSQIGTFNYQKSRAYELVTRYFGQALRAFELRGLINAITMHCQQQGRPLEPLSRSYRRSYVLMLKYIEENFDVFKTILPNVQLRDSGNRVIGPDMDDGDPARIAQGHRTQPRVAMMIGQH